jgi:hypothetical protein
MKLWLHAKIGSIWSIFAAEEKVTAAWTSEMFLKYCEQCAYDVP